MAASLIVAVSLLMILNSPPSPLTTTLQIQQFTFLFINYF